MNFTYDRTKLIEILDIFNGATSFYTNFRIICTPTKGKLLLETTNAQEYIMYTILDEGIAESKPFLVDIDRLITCMRLGTSATVKVEYPIKGKMKVTIGQAKVNLNTELLETVEVRDVSKPIVDRIGSSTLTLNEEQLSSLIKHLKIISVKSTYDRMTNICIQSYISDELEGTIFYSTDRNNISFCLIPHTIENVTEIGLSSQVLKTFAKLASFCKDEIKIITTKTHLVVETNEIEIIFRACASWFDKAATFLTVDKDGIDVDVPKMSEMFKLSSLMIEPQSSMVSMTLENNTISISYNSETTGMDISSDIEYNGKAENAILNAKALHVLFSAITSQKNENVKMKIHDRFIRFSADTKFGKLIYVSSRAV